MFDASAAWVSGYLGGHMSLRQHVAAPVTHPGMPPTPRLTSRARSTRSPPQTLRRDGLVFDVIDEDRPTQRPSYYSTGSPVVAATWDAVAPGVAQAA